MKVHSAWMVALLALASPGQPPAPATPSGLILGRVIDGVSGSALAGVMVQLTAAPAPGVAGPAASSRVLTSGDGYFAFHDLPRGSYTMAAAKAGYVPGAYGKRWISGTGQSLDLAEGERRGDVSIPMWRYAAMSGTITDEAGEPLIGVQVRLLRRSVVAGRWQLTQTGNQPATDDRGFYRFGQIVPGEYVAAVVSTMTTVPAAVQEAYTSGVASGAIGPYQAGLDSGAGSPLSFPGGMRIGAFLLKPGVAAPGAGAANDVARVVPPAEGGALSVYPSVYYPAATVPTQAAILTVAPGEERSNIDFQLRPVVSVRVSGTIVGPDGPSPSTEVDLVAAGTEPLSREASFETATAISDATGAFTFLGVTPGQYMIKVLRVPPRPEQNLSQRAATVVQIGGQSITSVVAGAPPPIPLAPTLSGALPVSVGDRDISGLAVTLRSGARITGHIEFVGAAPPPPADQLWRAFITIDSADGRTAGGLSAATQIRQGQVDGDGQVHTYQLPPGSYVIRGGAVAGWTFAGATLDGKDVADTPFDLGVSDVAGLVVRYTDRPADLSGTVRDDTRAATGAGQVLLFPADAAAWTSYGSTSRRLRSASPGKDGTFRIAAVPPGEYRVVAVPDDAAVNWQDPATLRKLLPLATAVTIGDGEKKTQDVVLRAVK